MRSFNESSYDMGTEREVSARLQQNIAWLEEQIVKACTAAGRPRSDVQVLPITKYVNAETTRLLLELGFSTLGESRPQIIWEKSLAIPQAKWHLVGHLQRNKVARTLPAVSLIHSIDSQRLLVAVNEEAKKLGKVQDVLLELHVTGEATKSGFGKEEWEKIPTYMAELTHIQVRGLMCMAALDGTPSDARKGFATVRALRDSWQKDFPAPHSLQQLSMGMTHDFAEAIAEGATIVRIGSALFEGIVEA